MNESQQLTGLLIGAGASYELGMPLVWDLTSELKTWLTPQKLRELNRGWRSQGGGHSDVVINDLASVLVIPGMHYEAILGHLETQFRRVSPVQQEYHALYSWLVEMVYHILYLRHVNNILYIERNIHFLEGIATLAAKNKPLWVFSLNHDVIIECLAAHISVPLNSGFAATDFSLPRRDKSGAKTGVLNVQVITAEQLGKGLPFFQHGSFGINLLKIHGALDIFAFRDGKDFIKLAPLMPTVAGVIEAMRAANEELLYVIPQPPHFVKATNEITYADETGEMQFLRRSLLAGAYKFSARRDQVMPQHFLTQFKTNINFVSTLACIGYGFGDDHINQVIRGWLEFSAGRRLEIVSPAIADIPPSLLHLSTQLTLIRSTATDYLDGVAGIVRSRRDTLEKRIGAYFRQSTDKEKARQELMEIMLSGQKKLLNDTVAKLGALPQKDGDLDLDAIGVSPEEWTAGLLKESGASIDDLLQSFLDRHPLT